LSPLHSGYDKDIIKKPEKLEALDAYFFKNKTFYCFICQNKQSIDFKMLQKLSYIIKLTKFMS